MQLLTVTQDVGPSRTVLSVEGELDLATVAVLRGAVREVLEATPDQVVLDLTAVEFIDSTGARELARAAKAGAAVGTRVAAVAPPDNRVVRMVVDFMGFGDLLPVHDAMPPE